MGAPEMAVPEICTGGGGDPCNSPHTVVAPDTLTSAMPWRGIRISRCARVVHWLAGLMRTSHTLMTSENPQMGTRCGRERELVPP